MALSTVESGYRIGRTNNATMGRMAQVRDVPDQSRYEILLDGKCVGRLDYFSSGESVTLPHTEIDPSYGGRGLGGELVRGALDDLRARGLKVRPACSFVRHFVATHPEYGDLVQGS
jgi:uncharacterized protein